MAWQMASRCRVSSLSPDAMPPPSEPLAVTCSLNCSLSLCPQLTSQRESFYMTLPTGSLFGSQANINHVLHLFKESMPMSLAPTTFFLTLLCPNLTPHTQLKPQSHIYPPNRLLDT